MTPQELSQIAYLARLDFDQTELEGYSEQMQKILSFIEQLSLIDTEDVPPMAHPLKMTQRLRLDHISEGDNHKAFQAIAPKVEQGFYLVPIVIE